MLTSASPSTLLVRGEVVKVHLLASAETTHQMTRIGADLLVATIMQTAVRDMAVDHALLVPNEAEDGLVFNTEFYDELVHSHKED